MAAEPPDDDPPAPLPPIRFSMRRILGVLTLVCLVLGSGAGFVAAIFGPGFALLFLLFLVQLPLMLLVRSLLNK